MTIKAVEAEEAQEQEEEVEGAEEEVAEEKAEAAEPEKEDFSDAFSEAIDEKAGEKEEVVETEKEDTEKKDAEEKGDPDKKDKEKGDEEEEQTPEEKAVADRAKTLLDQEKEDQAKFAEKKQAAEQAERDRIAGEESRRPITSQDATDYKDLITSGELPEILEIHGEEVKLKEYAKEYPEVQILAGLTTRKLLERLVDNGVLITADDHKKTVEGLEDKIADAVFDLTVIGQVSDIYDIIGGDDYKKWAKEASEGTKALLRSYNPNDFVMAVKEFKKVAGKGEKISKAKAELAKKKEIARIKKKEHDSVHSTTLRRSAKKTVGAGVADENDYSGAFKEAIEEK